MQSLDPLAIIRNRATVGGPQPAEMERMLKAAQQKLAQQFPDRNIPLEFVEPGEETPAQRRQRLQNERLHNAEAALRQDPVVKALISTFDATLVADSITLPH